MDLSSIHTTGEPVLRSCPPATAVLRPPCLLGTGAGRPVDDLPPLNPAGRFGTAWRR